MSSAIYSIASTNFIRTSYKVPEQRCVVNLDEEQGRQPGPKGPDTVLCIIRPTKALRMASLEAYLNKKMAFDNSVLECINFLDHVMRMHPSQKLFVFPLHFLSQILIIVIVYPSSGLSSRALTVALHSINALMQCVEYMHQFACVV